MRSAALGGRSADVGRFLPGSRRPAGARSPGHGAETSLFKTGSVFYGASLAKLDIKREPRTPSCASGHGMRISDNAPDRIRFSARDARDWLTENLADPAAGRACGEYHRAIAAYVRGLPDNDPELACVAGLLDTYDHGPGRRPDVSLSGDDEDTADVIAEILDDDETGCHGGPALSRESPAAFFHGLVDRASTWLAEDAEFER